jgi:asparagine synthase (glutamine-hydrolysing)
MTHVLPTLAQQYGEPFGDSSALPTYYVSRETRKHVTVALSGDGGDEMFAGYERYRIMKKTETLDLLPRALRRTLAAGGTLLPQRTQPALLRRVRRFLTDVVPASRVDRYMNLVGIFSAQEKSELYTDGFRSQVDTAKSHDYLNALFQSAPNTDLVRQLLYVDCNSYLPECLMAKVDIASMANSLEVRAPLLDHELMEYVFRLPSFWKLKGSRSKWIFKEIIAAEIPASILNRPKMGFGIPLSAWFRNELKQLWNDSVLAADSLSRRYFKMNVIQRLWDEHTSGRRDHGYRLWNLLMLELWHRSVKS